MLLPSLSLGNEVVDVNIENVDNCKKIVFSLAENPVYSVFQDDKNVGVKFKNTTIDTPNGFINTFKKAGIGASIVIDWNSDLEFTISGQKNIFKGHSREEPLENGIFFKVNLNICEKQQKVENVDDLININVGLPLDNEKTVDKNVGEIIAENVKAENVAELIALNNIEVEAENTKSLERQNNDKADLDNIIKKIALEKKEDDKKHDKEKIAPVKQNKYFIVVIDAGHGGIDSGAIGIMGTKEKDINLEFAKILKNELSRNKNIKVYLTRHSDIYLNLSARLQESRNLKANLLVSIHTDSNLVKTARGMTIYTLPKQVSYGGNAKYFLNHEFEKMAGHSKSNGDRIETFSTVLDVFRSSSFRESNKFVNILIENLRKQNINMLPNPHKNGNFAILLAPEFPSVLIELGFLSNIGDEKLLKTRLYKTYLAEQIAKSIEKYFVKSQSF
ncbi:hypothetical protein FACS1894152_5990 [Bacilli bacterium]|nr:hypothetical protein FACS1894152_5990 [Bacilli bacterium]